MRIDDYYSECEVTKPADIEAALSKRHGDGINSFMLSHGGERYPAMNIMVTGELAVLHYLPKDRDAGFVSDSSPYDSGETITFFVGPTEKIWAPNYQVVPFSDAVKAAQEFAISATLPKCIEWFRL